VTNRSQLKRAEPQTAGGRTNARDRVAAQKQAQRRRAARRRSMIVSGSVLAVVGGTVGVGIAVSASSTAPKTYAVPAGGGVVADPFANPADKATALAYGPASAPHTLTIFEDFRCPYCKALENGSSSVYKEFAAAGSLRVLFHPVTLIDANDGGSGSLEAGSASVCAAAAGKFDEFHDVLFADQPSESQDTYSSASTLIGLARQVPGLDSPTFESCVNSRTYQGLVQQNWKDFNALKVGGTPTLMLDGKTLNLPASFWKASPDGQSLVGSDPAVLRQALVAAGVPAPAGGA
jgi:protein-disulfide isomerase